MPLATAATAAAQLASTGFNAMSQGSMNRKTRRFTERMYERQKSDNIEFWRMQNEYNSPRAQMQRLQEAGLNPALMYGRGPGSDSAGSINSPSSPNWSPDAPRVDGSGLGESLSRYYNIEQMKAQTDNTRKLGINYELDAVLKTLDASSKEVQTARDRFELNKARELRQTSIEMANQQLRKIYQENEIALSQEERAAAMHEPNLMLAAEQVLNMKAATAKSIVDSKRIQQAIKLMKKDGQIRQLNIDLMKKGIYPSDGIISRIIGRFLPQRIIDNTATRFGQLGGKIMSEGTQGLGDYLNQNFKPFDWISRKSGKIYDYIKGRKK